MEMIADLVLPLVETVAIVFGVAFAAVQLRQLRLSRHRESVSEIVRSFQSPEFINAMARVYVIPDDMPSVDVGRDVELRRTIHLFIQTVETVGVLVYRRQVPIEIVDDIYGDSLQLCWRKLKPHVEADRRAASNPFAAEWCEWLVNRLEDRHGAEGGATRTPAFEQHADWKPG